jgi:phage terminase large subunit-like protein
MSIGRVVWANGAVAHLFSAEEGDRIRGYNFDLAWCDELAAFGSNAQHVWDMLQFSTRVAGPKGDPAQITVTTTPRPIPLLRAIIASPDTVVTRSRTLDNSANLDPATLQYLQHRYAGTTLGRQELDAEILDDVEGALWNRAMLDASRVQDAPETKTRVVVAIDPSGTGVGEGSECGIVVCCRSRDGHGYLLQDASARLSPERWARRAVDLYDVHRADRIIAERNYGGEMVEHTIRMIAQRAPVKLVSASRGKQIRAEPIVALYEQRRIHHVGSFPVLEDQLCTWCPNAGLASPDRLDALVWGMTELLVEGSNLNLEVWLRCTGAWRG